MIFLDLSEGMKTCKMSGKSQGILKWMINGNPEQDFVKINAVFCQGNDDMIACNSSVLPINLVL